MKVMRTFLAVISFIPIEGWCQQKDTWIKKLDSLSIQANSLQDSQKNNINPAVYDDAKIDFRTYFTLLGDDLKQQATAPFHTKKKDWLKVGAFALLTGAVALTNRPVNEFAKKLRDNSPGVASASKYITNLGGAYEVVALGGFFVYGLIFKTQKEKTTTVLATQAYITAGVIGGVGKYLFGEQRPYYTDPVSNKSGPIFRGPFYVFKKGPNGEKLSSSDFASFPSGHTTAAFAAATVYALEYRDKPLIPILSYSAATLIGLSRLTENKHWPVDVVAGAMLGYLSGKQVVNNFHRYSRLKTGKGGHEPVSFNLQYYNKQFLSGLVYKF